MDSMEELDNTKNDTANRIAELFPEVNSTIGVPELVSILKELDIDGNGQVSKKEIQELFKKNRGIVLVLFSDNILKALTRLNKQTQQSV